MNSTKLVKTERIRIGTDSMRYAQIKNEISKAVEFVNGPLHSEFDELGIEFSYELVKDVFSGGAEFGKVFNSKLNEDLSFMSIPASKRLIEKSAREGLQKFNNVLSKGKSLFSNSVFEFIAFEDGAVVFSKDGEIRLDVRCGLYLSDPDEINLYRAHQKACDALNEMFGGYISNVWDQLFEFDENRKFKPALANYDALLSKINAKK